MKFTLTVLKSRAPSELTVLSFNANPKTGVFRTLKRLPVFTRYLKFLPNVVNWSL